MRLLSERLAILQECDLTEGQARVYLALLEYPSGTASSLAKAAQLPRNRLYEVLEELNGMGLVDIVLEEPRRYKAKPIDSFLTRCSNDLRGKMERLESRRAYLVAAFEPREQLTPDDRERGTTQALTGRRAVAEEIDRMIADAQREVVLAGSAGGSLRLAKHLLEARPLSPQLAIEFYAPIKSAENGGWEGFIEAGVCDVTWVNVPRATITVVIDREELLSVHPVPDDERTQSGHDFALLTNNLAMIHDELLGIRNLPRAVTQQPQARRQS
ncbi:MAG: helix-turn-helix domain-containing protein [Candidatus Thermoplasmatota archaeon]